MKHNEAYALLSTISTLFYHRMEYSAALTLNSPTTLQLRWQPFLLPDTETGYIQILTAILFFFSFLFFPKQPQANNFPCKDM